MGAVKASSGLNAPIVSAMVLFSSSLSMALNIRLGIPLRVPILIDESTHYIPRQG